MKTKVFCMVALCVGLLVGCDKEPIIPEEPVKPPVEQPETPSEPEKPVEPEEPEKPAPVLPSTEDILNLKNVGIMAVVGSNSWYGIAKGTDRYVAVSYDMYTTVSTDGENWSTPSKISSDNNGLSNVVFGNGIFVATHTLYYSYVSTDGYSWTRATYPTGVANTKMNFANGIFIISLGYEGFFTSTNGINWTKNTSLKYLRTITYGNGYYVAATNNSIVYSTDLTNWSAPIALPGNGTINKVTFGNGIFVGVGYNAGACYAIYSTDMVNWNLSSFASSAAGLIDVTYTNGMFVSTTDKSSVFYSNDGAHWESKTISEGTFFYAICPTL